MFFLYIFLQNADEQFLDQIEVAKQLSRNMDSSTNVSPYAEEYLSNEEIEMIKEDSWLASSHINAALTIIRNTIPGEEIGGLYKVQLQMDKDTGFPRVEQHKWIQPLIVNCSGTSEQLNHWIIAAFGFNGHQFVTIYDPKVPSGKKGGIPTRISTALKQLTGLAAPKAQYMPCMPQDDGYNCGVYAICFATCLATGGNPSKQQFVRDQMRNHFKECLQKATLIPFPAQIDLIDESHVELCRGNRNRVVKRNPDFQYQGKKED